MGALLAGLLVVAPLALPRLVFLNRAGGDYQAGAPEDARADRSPALGQSGTLAPFPHGDAAWARVAACVRQRFAWLDLAFTEQDPGDVPHVECVVAGAPAEVGLAADTAGVGRVHCGGAEEHPLVFAFAGLRAAGELEAICETAAHEIGHAFGLDHVLACADPMSYLDGCGEKHFQTVAAPCGEGAVRACACGGDSQASFDLLFGLLGGTPPAPPSVAIQAPRPGAVIAGPLAVEVTTGGAAAPRRVDLYLDGARVDDASAPPFTFTLATPAAGPHAVEARLVDLLGRAAASGSVAFSVAGDPAPAAGCSLGGAGASPAGLAALLLLLATGARSRRARPPPRRRSAAAGCGGRRRSAG